MMKSFFRCSHLLIWAKFRMVLSPLMEGKVHLLNNVFTVIYHRGDFGLDSDQRMFVQYW